jgi:hypothetical protein
VAAPPAPPPPPPRRKSPPLPRASRQDHQKLINRTISSVQAALEKADPTVTASQAMRFAKVMLTRPGVQIGRGGKIFYQGRQYAPDAFAAAPLAKLITGQKASAANQAAIQGSPDYIQALASLGLQRDQSLAGLDDTQRQALIQFGDPTYASGDALTQGAALANPFSTERLARTQYESQASAANQAANRAGVLSGGGQISGQDAAQRTYAGTLQDAVTKLQALLGAVAQQRSSAQQAYGVGQSGAASAAYQNLLASGYHAATAPNYGVGKYSVRGFGRRGGGGGGGYNPPMLPGGGTGVTGTPGQNYPAPPVPVGYGGKPGGIIPPTLGGAHGPPAAPQPPAALSPLAAQLLQRYGLNVG